MTDEHSIPDPVIPVADADTAKPNRLNKRQVPMARARERKAATSKENTLLALLTPIIAILLPMIQIVVQRPIWFLNVAALIIFAHGLKTCAACFRLPNRKEWPTRAKLQFWSAVTINGLLLLFIGATVLLVVFRR